MTDFPPPSADNYSRGESKQEPNDEGAPRTLLLSPHKHGSDEAAQGSGERDHRKQEDELSCPQRPHMTSGPSSK